VAKAVENYLIADAKIIRLVHGDKAVQLHHLFPVDSAGHRWPVLGDEVVQLHARRCGVRCYSIPPLTPYVARPWRSRSSPCQRADTGDAEEVCTSYWRPPEKHNPTLTRPPPTAYPADPTGDRSRPDCLMRKEEQQGQSRPEEEGITPALPPPHRGGKKPRQVCGLFIGLREHDRRLISYGRRLTPMMLVVEREGNPGVPRAHGGGRRIV